MTQRIIRIAHYYHGRLITLSECRCFKILGSQVFLYRVVRAYIEIQELCSKSVSGETWIGKENARLRFGYSRHGLENQEVGGRNCYLICFDATSQVICQHLGNYFPQARFAPTRAISQTFRFSSCYEVFSKGKVLKTLSITNLKVFDIIAR
tara:strand:- start:6306 stop:6758 length:453 start_codon:yes stop_codon:yes gene_type:complete